MSTERESHDRHTLDGTTLHGVYVLSVDVKSQRDRDSPFVRWGIERLGERSRHFVSCKDVSKRGEIERGIR